jgi:hypothetical protein
MKNTAIAIDTRPAAVVTITMGSVDDVASPAVAAPLASSPISFKSMDT